MSDTEEAFTKPLARYASSVPKRTFVHGAVTTKGGASASGYRRSTSPRKQPWRDSAGRMRHRKARSDFDRCAASTLEEDGDRESIDGTDRPAASKYRMQEHNNARCTNPRDSKSET